MLGVLTYHVMKRQGQCTITGKSTFRRRSYGLKCPPFTNCYPDVNAQSLRKVFQLSRSFKQKQNRLGACECVTRHICTHHETDSAAKSACIPLTATLPNLTPTRRSAQSASNFLVHTQQTVSKQPGFNLHHQGFKSFSTHNTPSQNNKISTSITNSSARFCGTFLSGSRLRLGRIKLCTGCFKPHRAETPVHQSRASFAIQVTLPFIFVSRFHNTDSASII